jgi:hypothetical protein
LRGGASLLDRCDPFTPEQEPALRSKRFQVRRYSQIGCGHSSLTLEVVMRFAGNFNPEWGYLAPAPSFIRTVRIAMVAAAVGATAGAAVVFSLVDRPTAEESVAARTWRGPWIPPHPARRRFKFQAPQCRGRRNPTPLRKASPSCLHRPMPPR